MPKLLEWSGARSDAPVVKRIVKRGKSPGEAHGQ